MRAVYAEISGMQILYEPSTLILLLINYPHHPTIRVHLDHVAVFQYLCGKLGADDTGFAEFASDYRGVACDAAFVGDNSRRLFHKK